MAFEAIVLDTTCTPCTRVSLFNPDRSHVRPVGRCVRRNTPNFLPKPFLECATPAKSKVEVYVPEVRNGEFSAQSERGVMKSQFGAHGGVPGPRGGLSLRSNMQEQPRGGAGGPQGGSARKMSARCFFPFVSAIINYACDSLMWKGESMQRECVLACLRREPCGRRQCGGRGCGAESL